MLRGLISTGRPGAELGALAAAKAAHLKTGGYTPLSPLASLPKQFDLTAMDGLNWADCVDMNVMLASSVVILGNQDDYATEVIITCQGHGKKFLRLKEYDSLSAPDRFRQFVTVIAPTEYLFLTGSHEKESPGTGLAVERFLRGLLPELMV